MTVQDLTSSRVTSKSKSDLINVELSSRRTGMSFQRTRMSADRTLMSVIRTSLSLIGFGFTIFQFFEKLREGNVLASATPARNFGITLVALGIGMLVLGIIYHVQFMLGLRARASAHEGGRPDPRARACSRCRSRSSRRWSCCSSASPQSSACCSTSDRSGERVISTELKRVQVRGSRRNPWRRHRSPTSRTSSSSGATISAIEPLLLHARTDGLPDAQYRPHRQGRHAVHRLLRRAVLHGRPILLHHRAERLSHRALQGRHPCRSGRYVGEARDHRGALEGAGLRHRAVRQEPSRRLEPHAADQPRLR